MKVRRTALLFLLTMMVLPTVPVAHAATPVTVYYFHRHLRCVTCVALGDITAWVAEVTFRDRIADGTLAFRTVDYQEPANAHFVDDFRLEQPSAILAATAGDSVTTWKNLERIWELSENRKELEGYLTGEIRTFLEAHGTGSR